MLKKATPEKIIDIIRFSVAICFCWPYPLNSSRNQIFGFKVLQISTMVSACIMLLPLLYSIYLHNDDVIHISKCICISIGVTQLIVQTLVCFIKHNSLQVSYYSAFFRYLIIIISMLILLYINIMYI